ncbi:MAG: NYN domain-containing protein [Candidatus Kryptoniota bacterium]
MNHAIIDGYNLIYSDKWLSKLMKKDPLIARDALIDEIQHSIGNSLDVTLVFDGKFMHEKKSVSRNFRILFSSGGESADDVIKNLIGRAWNRRIITVVTNDLSIIAYAEECGSRTMNCKDFLSLLRTKKSPPNQTDKENPQEKPEHITKEDLELLKKWSKE